MTSPTRRPFVDIAARLASLRAAEERGAYHRTDDPNVEIVYPCWFWQESHGSFITQGWNGVSANPNVARFDAGGQYRWSRWTYWAPPQSDDQPPPPPSDEDLAELARQPKP